MFALFSEIDEIPQIIDWLQGNIKIVGIRPMSLHYFSLHNIQYQEKYVKVKPGFLTPLYDENNPGFDAYAKIEEKYLTSYLNNPIRTDVIYFFSLF